MISAVVSSRRTEAVVVRFVAPPRAQVDRAVFARPPLSQWQEFDGLLRGLEWPRLDELNAFVPPRAPRFVAQTPELLQDGLHYEARIAQRQQIATREHNWHDLLNAVIWLRHPELKSALNARQCAEISRIGAKQRTRPQCALTHFDEAGIVVLLRDACLLELWDTHDWHGLFWRERAAWHDGRVQVEVFGHALLEHALAPGQLLVGKALAVWQDDLPVQAQNAQRNKSTLSAVAAAIGQGRLLNDPQELRPLPLSGIPGWRNENEIEDFYRSAPCFCPLRAGRRYPEPLRIGAPCAVSRAHASVQASHSIGPL